MTDNTPSLSPEPTPPTNPLPREDGFRIALLASLPLTVISLLAVIIPGLSDNTGVILGTAALGIIASLVAFFWWQIKNTRERIQTAGFDTPSYWQVCFLFLLLGLLAGVASFAPVALFGLILPLAANTVQQIFIWVFTAFLVGRKLGDPWAEDISKIGSIIMIVLGAILVFLVLPMLLFVAIGLSAG